MKELKYKLFLKIWFIVGIMCMMVCACNSGDDKLSDEGKDIENEHGQQKVMEPISEFTAVATAKANELQLKWKNPSGAVLVEIFYALEVGGGDVPLTTNVRVYGEKNSKYTLQLPEYGTYQIGAVAVDNYGKRSEKVTISGTPAEKDAIDPDIIAEYKLPIADPYVLYHEGKYYAYGTRVNGFEVYISEDLKQWKRNDIKALSPENSWGTRWYWAPEVYYVKSKNLFYMFYSVDEHICVATSTSRKVHSYREKRNLL